jgi:hypothetical protein
LRTTLDLHGAVFDIPDDMSERVQELYDNEAERR